jgi:hypothetical protein
MDKHQVVAIMAAIMLKSYNFNHTDALESAIKLYDAAYDANAPKQDTDGD